MAGEQLTPPGITKDLPASLQAPADGDRSFFVAESSESLWLPPRDARLISPGERIETPVDDRGIVDINALIEAVKATVDPEYMWRGRDSTHHFEWPAWRYSYDDVWVSDGKTYSAGRFRDLPIHKGELPREFENYLHEITLCPPVPSREVMQYRIEAWRVAVNLFSSARRVVLWEKRAQKRARYVERNPDVVSYDEGDIFGEEYIQDIIDKHFRGVERHMVELERVPPEFRLGEPAESPKELATQLGRFVGRRSLQLRQQVNRQKPLPLAA